MDDGVLVFGLFLDGAAWNGELQTLQDLPEGVRFSTLPELHVIPEQVSHLFVTFWVIVMLQGTGNVLK